MSAAADTKTAPLAVPPSADTRSEARAQSGTAAEALAFLRARGVEVETPEDRAAARAARGGARPDLVAAHDDGGESTFCYVRIPADSCAPVVALSAACGPARDVRDVLPGVLAPCFADARALDAETVSRETASRMANMVAGGALAGVPLRAPSAAALGAASAGGVCEAYPLSARGRGADVKLYIDEVRAAAPCFAICIRFPFRNLGSLAHVWHHS